MGWMSLNNAIDATTPGWFNSLYEDLVGHIDEGCIGGSFFEYQDEIWKSDPLQQSMGVVSVSANTVNGQSSLSPNVWLPDIVTPKPVIYGAIQSGVTSNGAYNMNSNVFSLVGRSQYNFANVPSICPVISSSTSSTSSSSISSSSSSTSTTGSTPAPTQASTPAPTQPATTPAAATQPATTQAATTRPATSTQPATTQPVATTPRPTQASTPQPTTSSTSSSSSSTQAATGVTSSPVSPVSPVSPAAASGESPACRAACGTGSCCATPAPVCYDSSIYVCLPVESSWQLCGSVSHNGQLYMNGVCGTACYDTFCYRCSSTGLAPTGNC